MSQFKKKKNWKKAEGEQVSKGGSKIQTAEVSR